jgi:transcriptional regulator with XRE-family HTH domain
MPNQETREKTLIGQMFAEARADKGLTLKEVGELAGVSENYVSVIERGVQGSPPETTVRAIAMFLDIDPLVATLAAGHVPYELRRAFAADQTLMVDLLDAMPRDIY